MIEWKPYHPADNGVEFNKTYLIFDTFRMKVATLVNTPTGPRWHNESYTPLHNPITHYAEINTPNQQLAVESSTTAAALVGALIQIGDAHAGECGGHIGENEMREIAADALKSHHTAQSLEKVLHGATAQHLDQINAQYDKNMSLMQLFDVLKKDNPEMVLITAGCLLLDVLLKREEKP